LLLPPHFARYLAASSVSQYRGKESSMSAAIYINPRYEHLGEVLPRWHFCWQFLYNSTGGRCRTLAENSVTRFAQNCRCRAPMAGTVSHGRITKRRVLTVTLCHPLPARRQSVLRAAASTRFYHAHKCDLYAMPTTSRARPTIFSVNRCILHAMQFRPTYKGYFGKCIFNL